MKIGILVAGTLPVTLQGTFSRYGEMYTRYLAGRGFAFHHYEVRDGALPKTPEDCDGYLITGSRDAAYDETPWVVDLKSCVRGILDAGRPIVGICFGHQLLAAAAGGRVEKFSGGWTIGHQGYTLNSGTRLGVMAWHQDQVLDLPAGGRQLGRGDTCENALMLIETPHGATALGIQPHPEFDHSMVSCICDAADYLPPEEVAQARKGLGQPVHQAPFADVIEQFLKAANRSPDTIEQNVLTTLANETAPAG